MTAKKARRPVAIGDIYKNRDKRVGDDRVVVRELTKHHAVCDRLSPSESGVRANTRPRRLAFEALQTRWDLQTQT